MFLRHYIRSISKNPRLFLINILSFSVGLVAVMFLFLFVVKEFKTDRCHHKYHAIYRVLEKRENSPTIMSQTAFPMGNLFKNNYSEIQDFVRVIDNPYYTIKIGEKHFTNQKISYVDNSFFKMFDFKLDVGDYKQIFKNPNTIIIDRQTAKRYFNSYNVIGKTIEVQIGGEEEKKILTIVGILADYPEESTLKPQIIEDIKIVEKSNRDEYFVSSPKLFLYIPTCNNIKQLSENLSQTYYNKLNDLRSKKHEINRNKLYLQGLSDMYLHSSLVEDDLPKGDFLIVWILIVIGAVLLLVTLINYIILNVGLSIKNQKQNQINRVLGGSSGWIMKKYIYESVYYVIIAFIVALALFPLVHKIITRFSDYHYTLFAKSDIPILFIFFIALILLGVISGYVQYIVLDLRRKSESKLIRSHPNLVFFKYLITLQLIVFITSITALFIIVRQVRFIRTQDLGFDVKNTITVGINSYADKKLFIQECCGLSCIDNISVGQSHFRSTLHLDKVIIDESQTVVMSQSIFGDNNYIDVYKLHLVSGSNISGNGLPSIDKYYEYHGKEGIIDVLVNQEFVKKSGLKNPLGSIVTVINDGPFKGRITGIIDNVKNLPLYQSVTPIIIGYGFNYSPDIIISVKEGQMKKFRQEVISFFKKIGKESYFGYETYRYDFDAWYKKEQTLMYLLEVLSVIILFILLLGLIGISLFIAEQRTKEIGIRKVNGAGISEILLMLNMEFLQWVAIAIIISIPIIYFVMNKWLQNFAFKSELSWWIFGLGGGLAITISLVTISWQSLSAAMRSPVESLRSE